MADTLAMIRRRLFGDMPAKDILENMLGAFAIICVAPAELFIIGWCLL